MDFDKVCKKVMDLDHRIRFAGMINEKGRLFAGGMKGGVKSLEDTRDDEMMYMQLVLRAKMRREFDQVLGSVEFALSYRENIIMMSFPMKNYVLLLSAEKGIDISDIPLKVLQILRH